MVYKQTSKNVYKPMTRYDILLQEWADERYRKVHEHSRDEYIYLRYLGYQTNLYRCGIDRCLPLLDWLYLEV